MAPRVRFGDVSLHTLPEGVTRIDLTIENVGYLPSYVLNSARKLSWNEAPYLELELDGCELVEGSVRRHLNHLDGWGRGAGHGTGAPYYPYGRGNTSTAHASIVVRGSGTVTTSVNSCRLGQIRKKISVGQ